MEGIHGSSAAQTPTHFEQESINYDEVNDHVSAEVGVAEEAYLERIADLEQQFTEADDTEVRDAIRDEIERMESKFDDFLEQVDDLSGSPFSDDAADDTSTYWDDQNADELRDVVDDFRQDIADSYADFGTVTGDTVSDTSESSDDFEPVTVEKTFTVSEEFQAALEESSEAGEATEAADSGETTAAADSGDSGGGAVDSADFNGTSTQEMVDLLQNDPDAFREEMGDLDAEERQDLMLTVQQELQQMNQMFQMMSQFSQAMHDTQSAVIQNMRV